MIRLMVLTLSDTVDVFADFDRGTDDVDGDWELAHWLLRCLSVLVLLYGWCSTLRFLLRSFFVGVAYVGDRKRDPRCTCVLAAAPG